MKLQDKMLQFRAQNNLSQAKMAELCKISWQTYTNIERGIQKPSRLTLAKIEMVLSRKEVVK